MAEKDFVIEVGKLANGGLNEILKKALEKSCMLVEADAKKKCPVDNGILRNSIAYTINEKELKGIIGTPIEYAPYVEIGTGIYSSEGTGRKSPWYYKDEKTGKLIYTRGQKPQPFLYPALMENKQRILECFEGIL